MKFAAGRESIEMHNKNYKTVNVMHHKTEETETIMKGKDITGTDHYCMEN
jgi:hypothetical protein